MKFFMLKGFREGIKFMNRSMTKRPIFFVFVLILILGIAVFFLKDYIVKRFFVYFLEKKFGYSCEVERARIELSRFKINNFVCGNEALDITVNSGLVNWRFVSFFRPRISHVEVKGLSLELKDIEKTRDIFREQFASSSVARGIKKTGDDFCLVDLNLSDILIEVKNASWGEGKVRFSFDGVLRGSRVERIDDFDILEGMLRYRDFQIKNVEMRKLRKDFYMLTIPRMVIKKKEIEDLSFPLKIGSTFIELVRGENVFFGPEAYVRGKVEYKKPDTFCLDLVLERASFANIMEIINEKGDFTLDGLFGGDIGFCIKGKEISLVRGNFYNKQGGMINIKKEASLDFLRKYLDEDTYNRLIDNLKNYAYNKGGISLSTDDARLIAVLNFESEKMGKRQFAVTFHNIIGGGE